MYIKFNVLVPKGAWLIYTPLGGHTMFLLMKRFRVRVRYVGPNPLGCIMFSLMDR